MLRVLGSPSFNTMKEKKRTLKIDTSDKFWDLKHKQNASLIIFRLELRLIKYFTTLLLDNAHFWKFDVFEVIRTPSGEPLKTMCNDSRLCLIFSWSL